MYIVTYFSDIVIVCQRDVKLLMLERAMKKYLSQEECILGEFCKPIEK